MAATCDRPQLGRFTYDGTVWINTVSLPAFDSEDDEDEDEDEDEEDD